MLSIYVRKHLRVKSEVSLIVLDAWVHQVCPHDSPRRGMPERIRRIPAFQLWTLERRRSIAVFSPCTIQLDSVRQNLGSTHESTSHSPRSAKASDAHSFWDGFRDGPGPTPFDLLVLDSTSRCGNGPCEPVGRRGTEQRRRGRRVADDPQDGGGEPPACRGPVARDPQRVFVHPQEMGAVGRQHLRRATPAEGHPRIPRLGLRAGRHGRGDEPRPNGQQGPRAPPRYPVGGLRARADRRPPRFPETRHQRTSPAATTLPRPRSTPYTLPLTRWDDRGDGMPLLRSAGTGGALVVFFNYGVDTGTVWKSTPPKSRSVAPWDLDRQSPDREAKEQSPWGWLFFRRVKTGEAFFRPMNRVVHAPLEVICTLFLRWPSRQSKRFSRHDQGWGDVARLLSRSC